MKILRVKDISEKFMISEHAVRYYTDLDLIPTVKRDKNNIRYFNEDSFEWFERVIQLRRIGLSIASIKEYVELCKKDEEDTIQKRKELIIKQKEMALKKMDEIKTSLKYIQYKLDYFDNLTKSKTN